MSKGMMMKPGIILLKEGTDDSQGINQILSNISACMCVADAVRSTLGPRGMDKIIVDQNGSTTVSNDGATIVSKLDVVHPAAQILTAIAKSQDAEIGDGTTSTIILAAELLKESKVLIEDGIYPGLISNILNKCVQMCVEEIRRIAVNTKEDDIQMLTNCASTSMSSKLISPYKDIFSGMVVKSVLHLKESLSTDMIGIKKVSGGTMQDSMLVLGVAFKKTFSYAGFEMQPKKYNSPKIALLNVELELKAEKENAEIRINSVEEYQQIVDAEWSILYEKLDKIVASGAKVVLSRLPIGDVATQYFADRDIFCAGRVPEEDINRTMHSCGGSIRTVLDELSDEQLGSCETFEEIQIGNERYNIFNGGKRNEASTFILRGNGEQFLDEVDRSLHDAIMAVKRAIQHKSIVAGGGAVQMHLSNFLRSHSMTIFGKEQLIVGAFARALEIIPRQLCQNAGLDPSIIINALRPKHAVGELWFGVDLDNEGIRDNFKAAVWEPTAVIINAIVSAVESACTVLTVDETIKNASRDQNLNR